MIFCHQYRSVNELLEKNAADRPDDVAFSCNGSQVSHRCLSDFAYIASQYLSSLGVGSSDRVAIFAATASPEYLALSLGAMRLGAIAVCLNARFKLRELNHAIENSSPKLFFHAGRLADVVRNSNAPTATHVIEIEAVAARWMNADPPQHAAVRPEAAATPETPARIIYTSGTTSMPKACLHTHGAMLHQGFSVAERLALVSDDRFWTPLPLFHTGGWTPFLASQAVGAALHHPGHFDASESLRQIVDEQCTILFPSFETIWMQVLTHPAFNANDFESARLVLNVGVPERLELMQNLLPQVPQVSNTGCTEVGGFLCIGKATDTLQSRCNTAGRLLSGMEARIVDPESGAALGDGMPGELVVRGPSCLREYYGDPTATHEAIDEEGWFHTGDLVMRTRKGEFSFISRIKDMLKVGGENVAAAEIEGHLLTHPKVQIVAVVSAPDLYYGEVPAAFVELRAGADATQDELIDYCHGAIATFKIPRYVRFIADWPMSGTKIRKVELREQLVSELSDINEAADESSTRRI